MRFPIEGPPGSEQFQQIVEEFADRVYGIALRVTGSEADAEDAMQEAFLAIFRGLGGFRGESAFSTWVYRIAVNAALQVRRRRPPSEAAAVLQIGEAALKSRLHRGRVLLRQHLAEFFAER